MAEVDSGKPYFDTIKINNEYYRQFEKNTNIDELIWHRDRENREIEVVNDCVGWKIQFDNELPISLKLNDRITIPAMVFHRIIKKENSTELRLRIEEWKN